MLIREKDPLLPGDILSFSTYLMMFYIQWCCGDMVIHMFLFLIFFSFDLALMKCSGLLRHLVDSYKYMHC